MKLVTIPPPLQSRSQGTYPISIATSLALEGIFGTHEDIEYSRNDKYPYKRFNQLAINYRTLIRNIIGSVNSQEAESFTPEILTTLIAEEMSIINEVVSSTTRNSLQVVYYTAEYGPKTHRLFPAAKFKLPKTAIQLKTHQLEMDTLDYLQHVGRQSDSGKYFPDDAFANISDTVPKFTQAISASGGVAYLTHLPLDIVKTPAGRKALLESHTGKIKTEAELASKLRGKPNNIPFDIMTIQMFGDTGMVLDPQEIKFRKELVALGEKNGWNATTTETGIKGEIKRNGSKELNTLVRALYSAKVKF